MMLEINATDLFARVQNGESIALIDVRSPAEYSALHAQGAVNLPLEEVSEDRIAHIASGKSSVAFICKGGTRSKKACSAVTRAVFSVTGGTDAWTASGLPVVEGKGVISLERQVRIGAGALVLLGALGAFLIHPGMVGLSAFVGAGLIFAGVTDWCGMGLLLARMPWNTKVSGPSCSTK